MCSGGGSGRRRVSIPFIAGQWSLLAAVAGTADRIDRVSIPFIAGQWSLPSGSRTSSSRWHVSIPFIAGQWSLLFFGGTRRSIRSAVSIPFIAGQWSLRSSPVFATFWRTKFQSPSLRGSGRFSAATLVVAAALAVFQSPSLRGSGRFLALAVVCRPAPLRFNPLHCGAVVASNLTDRPSSINKFVSIPFIAGQWSLHRDRKVGGSPQPPVSIPFIAGQWSLPRGFGTSNLGSSRFQSPSLRGSGRFKPRGAPRSSARTCFNPLHCGAVVASAERTRGWGWATRFNPLHCGAVVASGACSLTWWR